MRDILRARALEICYAHALRDKVVICIEQMPQPRAGRPSASAKSQQREELKTNGGGEFIPPPRRDG